MSETTPLIKAALNLRVGAGFDVYIVTLMSECPMRYYNVFTAIPDFAIFVQ